MLSGARRGDGVVVVVVGSGGGGTGGSLLPITKRERGVHGPGLLGGM